MSLVGLIADLEDKARSLTIEPHDITNLRTVILDEACKQAWPELKLLIWRVWNAAVQLSQVVRKSHECDVSGYRCHVLPQMRLLVLDTLRAHKDVDAKQVFTCVIYTYKAYLDANDFEMCDKLFCEAIRMYMNSPDTSTLVKDFVLLCSWMATKIASVDGPEDALQWTRHAVEKYHLPLSLVVEFLYENTVQFKSMEWCDYGLEIIEKWEGGGERTQIWKTDFVSLKVEMLLHNLKLEQAAPLLESLPDCLNTQKLTLEHRILRQKGETSDPDLTKSLRDYLEKAGPSDTHILSLLSFVAEHSEDQNHLAVEFAQNVLETNMFHPRNEEMILLNSTKIACTNGNIHLAQVVAEKVINGGQSQTKLFVFSQFWNKALDYQSSQDTEEAVLWMECARSLSIDNEAFVASSRFISQCSYQLGRIEEALSTIDEALARESKCVACYLLKFRVLEGSNRLSEAISMVKNLLLEVTLDESWIRMLMSISAELYEHHELEFALDCLMPVFGFAETIEPEIFSRALSSCFAVIERIQDDDKRLDYIKTISNKIPSDVFVPDSVRRSVCSCISTAGQKLMRLLRWKDASECFRAGISIAGSVSELKYTMYLRDAECLIRLKDFEEVKASLRLVDSLIISDTNLDKEEYQKVKIETVIATTPESSEISDLIASISRKEILLQIVDFIIQEEHLTPEIFDVIFTHVKQNSEGSELTAQILQRLVTSTTNIEKLQNYYDSFFTANPLTNISSEHLQCFMAKAWNIGSELARSRKLKESQWWLLKALNIMKTDPSLCKFYHANLQHQYRDFLAFREAAEYTDL